MPFFTAVLKSLKFGGRFFTTESWECGLHLGADVNTGTAQQYATAIADWVGNGNSYVSSAAYLDYVKFNAIDITTGRYVDQTFSDTYNLPIPQQGGRQTGPPQISLVISLTTAQLRGRGHAGRFYPPSGGIDIGATGHVAPATVALQAGAAVTLIQAINAVAPNKRVCVYSPAAHILREVTGVRVGDVLDTQRRRRKGLPESYTLVPIT